MTKIAFCFVALIILYILYRNVWYSAVRVGQVIDSTSKAGIPNAAVLAVWSGRGFISTARVTLKFSQSISDDHGKFLIPGWGPRISPHYFAAMDATQPQVWVVAPGYFPLQIYAGPGLFRPIHLNASPDPLQLNFELYRLPMVPDEHSVIRYEDLALLARGMQEEDRTCLWLEAREFSLNFTKIEEKLNGPSKIFRGQVFCK